MKALIIKASIGALFVLAVCFPPSLCYAFQEAYATPQLEAAATQTPRAVKRCKLLQNSYLPGLKSLTCIVGGECEEPISVRVLCDGLPAAGQQVKFRIISMPEGGEGAMLSTKLGFSAESGEVSAKFTAGESSGSYLVAAFLQAEIQSSEPIITEVTALDKAWFFFLLFGLLGGLALFIYGMNLAGDNLQRAAGDSLRRILSRFTKNRFRAVGFGAIIAGLLQSSSAASVMLVGFVSASMLSLGQAIGAIMGIKIGATLTIQIISFDIFEYSPAGVALGFGMMFLGRGEKTKHTGAIILGFSLIFFGMGVMSEAMAPLRGMPGLTGMFLHFKENPLFSTVVGAFFTALVQTSAATIGLVMTFAAKGLLDLEGAMPICFGAAIGTCATALLSSIGSNRAAKQTAIAHLIYSVLAVAVFFPFMGPFVELSRLVTELLGSDSVNRQIANGYSMFSVIAMLLFVPFTKPFEKLIEAILPPSPQEAPFAPMYINEAALAMPHIALEQTQKEVERMADLFGEMLKQSLPAIGRADKEELKALIMEDDKLDTLERAIRPFLAKAAQKGLTDTSAALERSLIYITLYLEGAGDILTKEILHDGLKKSKKGFRFSNEGWEELKMFHKLIVEKFELVKKLIRERDRTLAVKILQMSAEETLIERNLRNSHLERLNKGYTETVESSGEHLSILSAFHAISEKLNAICEELLLSD